MGPATGRSVVLLVTIFLAAGAAAAQTGPAALPAIGGHGGSRVEVDIAAGSPGASAQALVTLYQGFTNVPISSRLAEEGALATFTGLPAGSYTVVVAAAGFQPDREGVDVTGDDVLYQVQVTLRPLSGETSGAMNLNPLLAPKARKELEDGRKALKNHDYDKARKNLNAAYRLAPGDPNVNFMMGMLALETKDLNEAQNYFLRATSLNPNHVPALVALGEARIEQKDYAGASQPLQTAVSVAPKNWVAHWLLATAELSQQEFERARHEAHQAVRLGKHAASSAQFVEGEALAALGQRQEAVSAFQSFVREAPGDPQAGAAREMISRLDQPIAADPGNPGAAAKGPNPGNSVANISLPLNLATGSAPKIGSGGAEMTLPSWQPPSLADEKLTFAPGAACPADEILNKTGADAATFASDLNSTQATEEVAYDNVDSSGKPVEQSQKKFAYIANVSREGSGPIVVEENRSGGADPLAAPAQMATFSASPLALAFHPSMRADFDFACRGLSQLDGRATWVVDFTPRAGRPPTLRTYETNGSFYPARINGRAWIAADTFHIVRIEADLAKPIPEIGLLHEHDAVTYGPVRFSGGKAEMWLPLTSDSYFNVKHHMYARRQTFSEYTRFSVTTSQKIGRPKLAESQK